MVKGKNFSAVAKTWDEKPQRVELASAVAAAISENIPLDRQMEALEFGSGTGLVTFHLHQQLKHVTAMDNAAGMLAVVEEKALAANVDNVTTCHNDTMIPSLVLEGYDLIFSSMVLHHVGDIDSTLKAFVAGLKTGGVLALADLVLEDGSFHDSDQGVERHGVDPEWLIAQLNEMGLVNAQSVIAHRIVKQRGLEQYTYPVFLVWACKE